MSACTTPRAGGASSFRPSSRPCAPSSPPREITLAAGTSIDGGETDGIADAVALAASADVVVLALGDRAGLFGRGTSGEGCDAESLDLPGAQAALLEAVLDAGTPTVLTLLAGRPYVLGTAPERAAGIVQAFFPGEEGTRALAAILAGRVNPSGRLPVSVPATPGAQPSTYLASTLARRNAVSNIDPTAALPVRPRARRTRHSRGGTCRWRRARRPPTASSGCR